MVPSNLRAKYTFIESLSAKVLENASETDWAGFASCNVTENKVFIKVYKHWETQFQSAKLEIENLKRMPPHKGISRVIETDFEQSTCKCTVVFEAVPGSDLITWIVDRKVTFTEVTVREIMWELLDAVDHAHRSDEAPTFLRCSYQ